jgi:hypothetical protein
MAIQYADILACFDDPAIPAIALAPDIAAKAEKRAKRRIQRNGNREPTGNPPGRPKSSPEQAAESKELAGPHLSPPFLTKVGGWGTDILRARIVAGRLFRSSGRGTNRPRRTPGTPLHHFNPTGFWIIDSHDDWRPRVASYLETRQIRTGR